jgi:hypothetical protein
MLLTVDVGRELLMDEDRGLFDLLFTRLADDDLPDEVTDLVLAAYAGDEQLRSALAGEDPDLPTPADTTQARPDPLYVQSVTVAGPPRVRGRLRRQHPRCRQGWKTPRVRGRLHPYLTRRRQVGEDPRACGDDRRVLVT